MKITTFAAPDSLKADVECIRITEHTEESGTEKSSKEELAIIEESLRLIDAGACCVRLPCLLERFAISQSQFERRFMQSVGVSPHFYLRVRRFNQAMKLMKSNRFERLTDLAHSLNFYDQSHFIRDIKEFSGLTPKRLTAKAIALYQDQGGYFYT